MKQEKRATTKVKAEQLFNGDECMGANVQSLQQQVLSSVAAW